MNLLQFFENADRAIDSQLKEHFPHKLLKSKWSRDSVIARVTMIETKNLPEIIPKSDFQSGPKGEPKPIPAI